MGFLTAVLLTTGAILALNAMNTSNVADKIVYNFKDVFLTNVQLLNSTLIVRLDVVNPTDSKLTISQVKLDVKINGQSKIGTLFITKNIEIASKSTQTIKLPMTVEHIGSGLVLWQMIKNGESLDFVELEGYITANGFSKNIKQQVPILADNI